MESSFRKACEVVSNHGTRGLVIGTQYLWVQTLKQIGRKANYGVRPFERDWDVLVVLDACRYDLFEEFSPKHRVYDEFDRIDSVYSCASASKEWMNKSFQTLPNEKLADTHYVTANGWVESELEEERFGGIEHVWKWAHDRSVGTVPPEPVTDQALRTYREKEPEKLIIHYAQPHAPFLHSNGKYQSKNEIPGEGNTQNVWKGLQRNEFSNDEVWSDYGKNLENVLDDVQTIINNVSGTIVITADHGNLIGEWGVYGHPSYVPIPQLKRVPWVIAEGNDQRSYELNSELKSPDDNYELATKEHLKDLGYF